MLPAVFSISACLSALSSGRCCLSSFVVILLSKRSPLAYVYVLCHFTAQGTEIEVLVVDPVVLWHLQ